MIFFFFSSRRRHTRWPRDWSSDVCSSDLGPVVQIVSIGSQITEAFAGLERIREIRNELAEDAGDEARASLPPVKGTVEFRDVTFEYKPGVPVLHGISFIARPGTSTALVGP